MASSSLTSGGTEDTLRRALAPASSMTSMALSGRYLSLIYLSASVAAETIASSVMRTR